MYLLLNVLLSTTSLEKQEIKIRVTSGKVLWAEENPKIFFKLWKFFELKIRGIAILVQVRIECYS